MQIPASVNPAPSQPPRGAPGGPGPVSLPADPRAYSGSPGLDLCHLPLLSLFLPKHWKVILSRFLTPLVPEKKKKENLQPTFPVADRASHTVGVLATPRVRSRTPALPPRQTLPPLLLSGGQSQRGQVPGVGREWRGAGRAAESPLCLMGEPLKILTGKYGPNGAKPKFYVRSPDFIVAGNFFKKFLTTRAKENLFCRLHGAGAQTQVIFGFLVSLLLSRPIHLTFSLRS